MAFLPSVYAELFPEPLSMHLLQIWAWAFSICTLYKKLYASLILFITLI
jgi:hypothetical protein